MMLFAWGANSYGQLGLGYASEQENNPKSIIVGLKFRKITGGGGHTLALTEDNRLYGCGWNQAGQLGLGHKDNLLHFTFLGLTGIVDVAGGWDFSCVVTEEGRVLASGSNKFCQLGSSKDIKNSTTFVPVPGLADIVGISAGLRHAVARDTTGQVYTWGSGSKGQLGRDWMPTQWTDSLPSTIDANICDIDSVVCGQFFTIIKTSTGDLYGFGDNKFKQISTDNEKYITRPTVLKHRKVASISSGWTHCIAMDNSTQVHTWGRNNYGQCGIREFSQFHHSTDDETTGSISIENNATIVKCLAGSEHCIVLDSTGGVFTWGWNEHGNLGNGKVENLHSPSKIIFDYDANICDIFVGSAHCFAYSE